MIRKFIKFPKKLTKENLVKYFKKNNLIGKTNIKTGEFYPELNDLYILHQLIILNALYIRLKTIIYWTILAFSVNLCIITLKYDRMYLQ